MTSIPNVWLTGGALAAGGIITAALAGWRNVQGFFQRLTALLIVTELHCSRVYVLAIFEHIVKNNGLSWRHIKLYHSLCVVERKTKHWKLLVGQQLPATTHWIWFRGRPLRYEMHGEHILEVKYFRWTFHPQYWIRIAQDAADASMETMNKARPDRFGVELLTGNRFDHEDKRSPPAPLQGRDSGSEAPKVASDQTANPLYNSASMDIQLKLSKLPLHRHEDYTHVTAKSEEGAYFMSPNLEQAAKELETWLDLGDWYADRSVTWKRGWLLSGIPGSGKSTFILYIARRYKLPLYVFDLVSMTNKDLQKAWATARSRSPCIVMFEDIDAVFQGRKNITDGVDRTPGVSFDCLLNILDGVQESNGIFTVITTNHPEHLDEALAGYDKHSGMLCTPSRPGRIDRILQIGYADDNIRRKIAAKVLSQWPDEVEPLLKAVKQETAAQCQERCVRVALQKIWEQHQEPK